MLLAQLASLGRGGAGGGSFPGQAGNPVGYANAPGYAGLTPYSGGTGFQNISGSGTSASPLTYTGIDFDSLASGVLVSGSWIKFVGCRFQSNQVGYYNVDVTGANIDFEYCSFVPRAALVAAPPNAAWPSASAGLGISNGSGSAAYAPYMANGNNCYQYGVAVEAAAGSVTLRHCDFWGFGNAVTFQNTTAAMLIDNCWFHDAANPDPQAYHTDGPGYLNGTAGPSNVTISNCTIASIGNTNGIAFQLATSGYSNINVSGCYLSGFGFHTSLSTTGNFTNSSFKNNVFGTDLPWQFGPIYSDLTAMFHGGGNVWSGNKLNILAGTVPFAGSNPLWTSADNGKFMWPDSTLHVTDFV